MSPNKKAVVSENSNTDMLDLFMKILLNQCSTDTIVSIINDVLNDRNFDAVENIRQLFLILEKRHESGICTAAYASILNLYDDLPEDDVQKLYMMIFNDFHTLGSDHEIVKSIFELLEEHLSFYGIAYLIAFVSEPENPDLQYGLEKKLEFIYLLTQLNF